MNARIVFLALICAATPSVAQAAQGFNCDAFLKLDADDRRWYLRGYLLSLGMTVGEMRNSVGFSTYKDKADAAMQLNAAELERASPVVRVIWSIAALERQWKKAMGDQMGFETSLLKECREPDSGGVGMFQLIPNAIGRMRDGGESEWPMADELRDLIDTH